jgi:nicotinate-nucleotide pyrophosphorylase (carboxylating)
VLPESFFVWIDSAQKHFKPSPSLGELPKDLLVLICIYDAGLKANLKTCARGRCIISPEPTPIPMKPDHYDPIAAALKEDIGQGDVTTDFFVPATLHAIGRIIARERAVVAGTGTAAEVFRQVDPSIDTQILRPDGDEVVGGDVMIEVRGLARSILKAERVALNFLQRLCGIATLTRQFVETIKNHPAKILDTRKTTPGLRSLEKAAVLAGGGENHRFGLYDMVLVKDNHLMTLDGLSGFADRIKQLRQERQDIQIEVEADDLEQVRAFVEIPGIDVILLDNMVPAQIREAVALKTDNLKFEASGGITLKNVNRIAATGVDYISVGSLTHAARAIDIGLEITHVPG